VSASVNLPLHHKVQKFSSGTSLPGGPGKGAIKRLWWRWWWGAKIAKAHHVLPLTQNAVDIIRDWLGRTSPIW